jgi:hypothetical protein
MIDAQEAQSMSSSPRALSIIEREEAWIMRSPARALSMIDAQNPQKWLSSGHVARR